MYQEIKYETDGAAAVITLNRPEKLNALTPLMMAEMRHALAEAEKNADIAGMVLTGAGRGFCSGADMNSLDAQATAGKRDTGEGPGLSADLNASPGDPDMGLDYQIAFTYLMSIRKPIIAAVNGPCAGLGMSIALLCDLRFMAESAKFITSFSQRGLIAEHGQSWILPRIVGPSRALDLFWSSRRVGATEAIEMGLANRVFPDDELVDGAKAYLHELAQTAAPLSLMTMKQQVYRHLDMSLGDAMNETTRLMDEAIARPDFKEGVASFMERRPPKFNKVEVK